MKETFKTIGPALIFATAIGSLLASNQALRIVLLIAFAATAGTLYRGAECD